MSLPPVLLLGVDTPIGLSVMRELGRQGVPVHGIGRTVDAIGAASHYCTRFHLRGTGPLADWLPDLARRTGAAALMAISEGDLIALAALPDRFGDCRILTPRAGPLGMVLDKDKTLALARSLGIATPVNFTGMPDRWPVVLKWADPMAVQPRLEAAGLPFHKAEFAQDAQELSAALARYAPLGMQPLVQSYAAGHGVGQMFYRHKGETTLYFQHERLHEWPPEGGVSTLCQSLPAEAHASQRALSEKLLDAIGWEGPAMVEYRFDPATADFVLMEINGRFWGSLPLATAAGAAFGWEQYRRNVLAQSDPAPAYRAGIKARYMIPETRRLVRIFAQRSAIRDPRASIDRWKSLALWLAGFVDPKTYHYVLTRDDPGPFFADVRAIVRKALRRGKAAPAGPAPGQSAQSKRHNKAG